MGVHTGSDAGTSSSTLCGSDVMTPEIDMGDTVNEPDTYDLNSSQLHLLSQLDESFLGVGALPLESMNSSSPSLPPVPSPLGTPQYPQGSLGTTPRVIGPTEASIDSAQKISILPLDPLVAATTSLPEKATIATAFKKCSLADLKSIAAQIGVQGTSKKSFAGPLYQAIYVEGCLNHRLGRHFEEQASRFRRKNVTEAVPDVFSRPSSPGLCVPDPTVGQSVVISPDSITEINMLQSIFSHCCERTFDTQHVHTATAVLKKGDILKWQFVDSDSVFCEENEKPSQTLQAVHAASGLYVAASNCAHWIGADVDSCASSLCPPKKSGNTDVESLLQEFRGDIFNRRSQDSVTASTKNSGRLYLNRLPDENLTERQCTAANTTSGAFFNVSTYTGIDTGIQTDKNLSHDGRFVCVSDMMYQSQDTWPQDNSDKHIARGTFPVRTPEFTQYVIDNFGGSSNSVATPEEFCVSASSFDQSIDILNALPVEHDAIENISVHVDNAEDQFEQNGAFDDIKIHSSCSSACMKRISQYYENICRPQIDMCGHRNIEHMQSIVPPPTVKLLSGIDYSKDSKENLEECGIMQYHSTNEGIHFRKQIVAKQTLNDFPVGSIQDVFCTRNRAWYRAKILHHVPAISLDEIDIDLVKVHYIGWSKTYDEVLDIGTGVVQRLGLFTSASPCLTNSCADKMTKNKKTREGMTAR